MASGDPKDVLIKATPIRSAMEFASRELGRDGWMKVLDAVEREFPAEIARLRRGTPIASERFPVVFANRLMELIASELHQPADAVAHRIGRAYAKDASTGVMRLAMTLLSVPSLLRKIGPIWSQTYSHGTIDTQFGDRTGTVELKDFPAASKTGCARVTGTFEWFGEQAEKTFRIRHAECGAAGRALCRWQFTW